LGTLLGLAGSLALTGYLKTLLFQVTPTDPTVFAGVVMTVFAVATLACFVPAWRASKLDPVQTLRHE
jgi:putative ABC transport system permease protein